MTDHRLIQLQHWLTSIFKKENFEILPLADDASFRRYFRIKSNAQTWVAMDAPPTKEKIEPFIAIAKALAQHHVNVPMIIASDIEQGFILLSDLGDELYLKHLNKFNVDLLYSNALSALLDIQRCERLLPDWPLPAFAETHIRQELNLFPSWFLEKHLSKNLTSVINDLLEKVFLILVNSASAQPQVCIHRDYHSRNLLILPENRVGVLDFQDAMWGPITYDLVSLLRDCYIVWPRQHVEQWALNFFYMLRNKHNLNSVEEFLRWFDLMGIQRHLKVLGIFCRLSYRDNKHKYLNDLPRVLNYIIRVCENYSELIELRKLLLDVTDNSFSQEIKNISNN